MLKKLSDRILVFDQRLKFLFLFRYNFVQIKKNFLCQNQRWRDRFPAKTKGAIRQLFDDRGCVPATQAEALGAN